MSTNPEATNHAELQRWGQQIHDALDGRPLPDPPDEAPARIRVLLAERDAAVKERDEYDGWREYWLDRAQKAEASLTRYRRTLDHFAADVDPRIRRLARAALDGSKEVAGTHGATEISGREYE